MASTKWRDVFESEDNLEKKKNILNEEIQYGVSLRKDRIQEKQILLAPDDDSLLNEEKDLILPMSKSKKKKKKKKRKAVPLCQTLSAEKFVINRNACSRKEYYDLMSQPRPTFCPAEPIKIKTKLTTWSPRFAQLAIPLKQRIFNTWQDYNHVLSPEQILGLQQLMYKEEALAPKDASDYFKSLDKQKKIEKRKKLKKQKQEVVKKPQKTKIKKEINVLAKSIMKTFTGKEEATVKCAHIMMTEMIKRKLEEENLLPVGTKRSLENDVYSQTLYETLDQLSVWLLSNIGFDELEEDEEEEQKEASSVSTFSSITYSDVSTIRSAVSAVEPEQEIVLVEEKLEPSEAGGVSMEMIEEEEAVIEKEMEELAGVEGEVEPTTEVQEEGEEEVPTTMDEIKEEGEPVAKIEGESEAEDAVEEVKRSEEEGESPIIEEVDDSIKEETTSPPTEVKFIELEEGGAAEEGEEGLPAAEREEGLLEAEGEEGDEVTKAEEAAEAEMIIQAEVAGEELPEVIEMLTFPKEEAEGEEIELAKIAPEEMAEIKETEQEILELHKEILEEMGADVFPGEIQPRTASEVEEHSPDAMCCVTIKTWAKWLVDVSHNTYHWSQWIQDVISRVRLFVAIIRGEVMNPDGKPRKLYKEEWNAFTEMLDKDIDSWKKYNEHVKTISEKIIAEFQNKRIICCPACLQSKIIISEETAHQVTDDLVKALNTSSYFRDWLDAIVAEAKKFRDLKFELPPAPGDSEVSSGSSFGIFELIELKSPDTITKSSNSSGSVCVIEEVNNNGK